MPLTVIKVKSNFTALHRWLNAPMAVSFLRSWHRHIFNVEVWLEVGHGDRQLEFFTVKKRLDRVIDLYRDSEFEYSCEQLAEQIATNFEDSGYTVVAVKVNEDGENGGIYYPHLESLKPAAPKKED